jgi:hypothetical protein
MRIKRVYLLSIIIGYLTFIMCGTMIMLINSEFWIKGFILLFTGGIFYIPIYLISNLTQFLCLKYPRKIEMIFFSSAVIIGIISLVGIQLNIIDNFLWKILIPSQVIVCLISLYYYKHLNKL